MKRKSLAVWPGLLAGLSLTLAQEAPPPPPLPRPAEEIIQHLAQKEAEYAQAHAQYAYRLSIKLQEIDGEGAVVGEFNEVLQASLSPTGRRIDRVVEGPRSSLQHLGVTRVELADLSDVPLFTVRPEDLSLYRFDYVGREQIDEVDTFLFKATPTSLPRDRTLFEGLLWVDADKLDVVKAFGRSVPARRAGVLKSYFQRVEIYRQPVDDYLFTVFIQAEDVLSVVDQALRARMILRFTDHQRLSPATPSSTP